MLWGPEPLGARRLLALVRGLSPASAFHRAQDPDGWWWTQDTELLASAVEELHDVRRLLHVASFKPPHPEPLRVPRPWPGTRTSKPGTTMAEFRQTLTGSGGVYIPKEA